MRAMRRGVLGLGLASLLATRAGASPAEMSTTGTADAEFWTARCTDEIVLWGR